MRLLLTGLALAATLQSVNSFDSPGQGWNQASLQAKFGPSLRSTGQANFGPFFFYSAQEALDNNQAIEIKVGDNGLRPITQVSSGGDEPYELMIDTGSAVIAFCPNTEINAKPIGKYMCQAYGDGSYGWTGELYSGELTLGFSEERITSPQPAIFAHMAPGSVFNTCGNGLDGIMGVDMSVAKVYSQKQNPPSKSHIGCANADSTIPAQFVKQALVEGDSYSMSFINLNLENEGVSLLAFGEEATTLLEAGSTLLGSAKLVQSQPSWYTLIPPFEYELNGYKGCGQTCKTTWNPDSASNPMDVMVVDSGTPMVVIPPPVIEAFNLTDLDFDSVDPKALSITITAGTASLSFTVEDLIIGGGAPWIGPPAGPTFPQGVLGWPLFLKYDVKFTDTPDNVGEVSFYQRKN